jgi:hypothetical protein
MRFLGGKWQKKNRGECKVNRMRGLLSLILFPARKEPVFWAGGEPQGKKQERGVGW